MTPLLSGFRILKATLMVWKNSGDTSKGWDKRSNSKWFWDVLKPLQFDEWIPKWWALEKSISGRKLLNMTSFWVSILHFRHGLKPVTTEKKKNRLSCLVIMLPTFFAVFLGTTSPNHQAYFPQPTDQSNKSYIIPEYCTPNQQLPPFRQPFLETPVGRGFFQSAFFSSVCWNTQFGTWSDIFYHQQISFLP